MPLSLNCLNDVPFLTVDPGLRPLIRSPVTGVVLPVRSETFLISFTGFCVETLPKANSPCPVFGLTVGALDLVTLTLVVPFFFIGDCFSSLPLVTF